MWKCQIKKVTNFTIHRNCCYIPEGKQIIQTCNNAPWRSYVFTIKYDWKGKTGWCDTINETFIGGRRRRWGNYSHKYTQHCQWSTMPKSVNHCVNGDHRSLLQCYFFRHQMTQCKLCTCHPSRLRLLIWYNLQNGTVESGKVQETLKTRIRYRFTHDLMAIPQNVVRWKYAMEP